MDTILEKINKASLKFLEPLTPAKTCEIIVQEAKKLMGAEFGSIFLEKKGELERIYASSSILHRIKIKKNAPVYNTFQNNIPTAIDSNTVKNLNPTINKMGIKSFVLIPLSYKEKSIGVLSVLSLTKKSFTQKEFEALKLFGSMASLAIRKTQLYDETKKALEDRDFYMSMEQILEKINRAAIQFLAPLTLTETYKKIVEEAIKLVNAHYCSLTLEENGIFKEVYSTLPIRISSRKKGFTYKAFKEARVFLIHPLESPEFLKAHPEVTKIGVKSILLIPLTYKKQSIGVLIVNSKNRELFTKKELKILLLFGTLATLAIRKSQLHAETQKAIEVRDLFTSLAAHELRTPLTTINGYIQLLQTHLSKLNIYESKWIEHISEESQRLTKLVSELLEINRIRNGSLQFIFKECSLVKIIGHAVDNFKVMHPDKKISFQNKMLELNDKIIGDYNKLLQVFSNILENSVKFSSPKSSISVSINSQAPNFIIKVIDKGKGIHKEDIPRVFEGFYKGKNRNEEKGMGLGLYLAKNIIEKHHGEIHINSQIGKGTTVEIRLPHAKL